MKQKIAVIAGGDSSESEVSMRSAREVHAALDRELFDPYIIIIKGTEWKTEEGQEIDLNTFSFENDNEERINLDYALIMIHGTPGENGILQGYFDLMRIPYSSCGTEVSALTFNKSLCKKAIAGVPEVYLAREITIRRGDEITPEKYVDELGLPFFIKPNASGSSFGVTKIKSIDQITPAIEIAFTESDTVLMEEFIEGTEVSHGIMSVGDKDYVLPVTELVSKNEFFDYEAKYTDGLTEEITPARIPSETTTILNHTTLNIYKALSCKGVVRIDYIIKEGKPYFIEINTVPGMSRNSIIPQQWREIGLTMTDAFRMIITNKPQ